MILTPGRTSGIAVPSGMAAAAAFADASAGVGAGLPHRSRGEVGVEVRQAESRPSSSQFLHPMGEGSDAHHPYRWCIVRVTEPQLASTPAQPIDPRAPGRYRCRARCGYTSR